MVKQASVAAGQKSTVCLHSPVPLAAMRAIVAESAEQLTWQEVPDISPDSGEVLIKVSAAGVNRADVLQAAGNYPPPPGASQIIGLEVSGTIVEVGGGVDQWAVGQQVCGLLAGGGYAEFVAVPAGQVMPVPDGVPLHHAAGLPEVACTVWSNLMMTAHLAAGQLLLIHGGASGIGTHAIQVARRAGLPGGGHGRVARTSSTCARNSVPRSPSTTAMRTSWSECAPRAAPT